MMFVWQLTLYFTLVEETQVVAELGGNKKVLSLVFYLTKYASNILKMVCLTHELEREEKIGRVFLILPFF